VSATHIQPALRPRNHYFSQIFLSLFCLLLPGLFFLPSYPFGHALPYLLDYSLYILPFLSSFPCASYIFKHASANYNRACPLRLPLEMGPHPPFSLSTWAASRFGPTGDPSPSTYLQHPTYYSSLYQPQRIPVLSSSLSLPDCFPRI
jgi:hypothetical protein